MVRLGLLGLLAACAAPPAAEPGRIDEPIVGKRKEGAELIGKPAPSLANVTWADGKPHPLSEDEGKAVLVRWWTDGCPLCTHSAPAFAELQEKYGDRLSVRAIFHNKVRGRDVDLAQTRALAEQAGFSCLVGKDEGWADLRRWWLNAGNRAFTSVTFLLDGAGTIRLIHTGGEFHTRAHVPPDACLFDPAQCEAEYEAIDRAIGALISSTY